MHTDEEEARPWSKPFIYLQRDQMTSLRQLLFSSSLNELGPCTSEVLTRTAIQVIWVVESNECFQVLKDISDDNARDMLVFSSVFSLI